MALIKCPECGREISDKAESCPHCGMPIETSMTVAETKTDESKITESGVDEPEVDESKLDEHNTDEIKIGESIRKRVPRKFAIIAVVIIAIVIAMFSGGLSADGKIALRDCKTLQDMCKVPSSFEVYEAIVYHSEESGVCTYITYGAENSYGAQIASVAIFADGMYLGDFSDDEDDFYSLAQYDKFLMARLQYKLYVLYGSDKDYANECGMKFINTDKLMKKLDKRY